MTNPKNPTSFRLPDITVALIDELGEKLGLSRNEVVMTAVDRMALLEEKRAERRAEKAAKEQC